MGKVPKDITGRKLEVGQTVTIDCWPHDGRGIVAEVFDHAGYVHVRYPGSFSIVWPPSLRILDPVSKVKKPNLKARLLRKRNP